MKVSIDILNKIDKNMRIKISSRHSKSSLSEIRELVGYDWLVMIG